MALVVALPPMLLGHLSTAFFLQRRLRGHRPCNGGGVLALSARGATANHGAGRSLWRDRRFVHQLRCDDALGSALAGRGAGQLGGGREHHRLHHRHERHRSAVAGAEPVARRKEPSACVGNRSADRADEPARAVRSPRTASARGNDSGDPVRPRPLQGVERRTWPRGRRRRDPAVLAHSQDERRPRRHRSKAGRRGIRRGASPCDRREGRKSGPEHSPRPGRGADPHADGRGALHRQRGDRLRHCRRCWSRQGSRRGRPGAIRCQALRPRPDFPAHVEARVLILRFARDASSRR